MSGITLQISALPSPGYFYSVIESIVFDRVLYVYRRAQGPSPWDTLSVDQYGDVFINQAGSEYLWLNFSGDSATVYETDFTILSLEDTLRNLRIQITKPVTVETVMGTFENCIMFDQTFIPRWLGDHTQNYYAPNIGLVLSVRDSTVINELHMAIIDGDTIR